MIHTFIPEGSESFVILPILWCSNFPLSLITGHGNTKRLPKESPVLRIYSSLPPLCSSDPTSPLTIWVNHPVNTVTPYLAGFLSGMKIPTWPGGSLSFQFNGIIVVLPGISLPLSGTKTSKPTEHKVMGTGSKYFASGSLEVMVSGTIPLLPLDSWIHESWLWETIYHIVEADSKHTQPFEAS